MADVILRDVEYGTHERHKVDIYIPENIKSDCGLIFYIHGGGWQKGDKSDHKPDCEYFCNIGYIVASMNYRYVSEDISIFDELDDIVCALNTVNIKCSEHNLNIQKVIFSGGSAGAHLALMYAYTRFDDALIKPVAACVYCPPVDCSKPDFLLGISGEFESWKYDVISKCASCAMNKETYLNLHQQAALKKMSPVYYVNNRCVPTAIFHGKNDDLIPLEHINEFMTELKNSGIITDFLLFENSGHVLDKDPESHIAAKKIIEEYALKYL